MTVFFIFGISNIWYPKWATISHASQHSFLRAACLPIPSFGRIKEQFIRDAQLSFNYGESGLATRNIWTSHGHSFILSIKHKHTSIVRIFLSLLKGAHKPWKINTITIGLRLTSFYLYIYSDKWETSLSLKTVVLKLLAPGRSRIATVGLTTKHISRDIQKIDLFRISIIIFFKSWRSATLSL